MVALRMQAVGGAAAGHGGGASTQPGAITPDAGARRPGRHGMVIDPRRLMRERAGSAARTRQTVDSGNARCQPWRFA